ncbi:hypothetical protein M407DRAFT_247248 [Tulasnella calospora MUT 4182]|uniref:Uncharacterized protein n=1 Tax=Tulasnella calospora MUT 4182 TaxID=1051891 RepID=A0A0C3Q0E5_9AGAM|nr:hypothetical protein M407DRAFT_247248 [Tulasnella calospora MUT 4182]
MNKEVSTLERRFGVARTHKRHPGKTNRSLARIPPLKPHIAFQLQLRKSTISSRH